MTSIDPLGSEVVGMLLRCAGTTSIWVWRGQRLIPCATQIVVPFDVLGSEETLQPFLAARDWALAVSSAAPGAEPYVAEGQLQVPGGALLSPLCPSCKVEVLKRLRASS